MKVVQYPPGVKEMVVRNQTLKKKTLKSKTLNGKCCTWRERDGYEEWHCCDRNPRRSACSPPADQHCCNDVEANDGDHDEKVNEDDDADLRRGLAEGEP